MAWVKIDDGFAQHPKLAKAGPLAMAMQIAALCYCNRNLTDGFVPRSVARTLLDWETVSGGVVYTIAVTSGMQGDDVSSEWVISLLLDAGIWREEDGGFRIHDYEKYQPLKADVLAEREKASERMKRARSGEVRANINGSSLNPVPDPVPVKKEKKDKEEAPAAPSAKDELGRVLDEEHANAVIDHRQKLRKPLTAHAAKLLANSFAKCRDGPNAAADAMIANGWQGFNPAWIENRNGQHKPSDLDNRRATADAIDDVVAMAEARRRELGT
jgi:hypothetical protein